MILYDALYTQFNKYMCTEFSFILVRCFTEDQLICYHTSVQSL